MDRLPIFLKLRDRPCLIVGGGDVAERKARLLLRSGATITVLAPEVTASLQQQIERRDVAHLAQCFDETVVADYWLIIAATDDDAANRRIADAADAAGRLCNVVDDNDASTFILPAIVDRSPVVIAIGTEGNAPVLAQQLKIRIEAWLPGRIGELAAQAGRWRGLVKKRFATVRERRRFWQRFFAGPIADHLLAGRQAAAEQAMRAQVVGDVTDEPSQEGEAWIVGAGPGDPGLVTLRAQQLIAAADVVLYDRLVTKPVLDFARKEADLIAVGKCAGAQLMSQERINDLLVKLVSEGKRVCRLKGGDPFIFGRGGEEALALAKARLPFQIVPGVTAATGCAAYAGIPLTLRGVSGSVTLATARLGDGVSPEWLRLLRAGDTLALYMGIGAIPEFSRRLLEHGVSADLPVAIVENGTTESQRAVLGSIGTMWFDARRTGLRSPAMIYIGKAVNVAEQLQWFSGQSGPGECFAWSGGELAALAG